jgi:hypothetical protein
MTRLATELFDICALTDSSQNYYYIDANTVKFLIFSPASSEDQLRVSTKCETPLLAVTILFNNLLPSFSNGSIRQLPLSG